MSEISFRLVREDDMPLLHRWLNEPHLHRYYQKTPISLAEVEAEFLSTARGETPTRDHIALLDGRPFGKIQSYRNMDYPDYAESIGVSDGASVDLLIGEPDLLGKGFGRRMLRSYIFDVVFTMFPAESRCYICHDATNVKAIACSRAVGFHFLRNVTEEGVWSELLVIEKRSGRSRKIETACF